MAEEILRLNEFFVEGGNPELSHVLLHITEPSTPEEKAKGYFFAVCEINEGTPDYIKTIQTTITDIENKYYDTHDEENDTSLEAILEEVNQTLPARPNLHCLIGVIRYQQIIFSFSGSPIAVFFYKNKAGQYQKMDLIKTSADPSSDESDSQLFSQVIQGKISPGDYLCIGTPQFGDYFNADRLQKIITVRPPRQSAEHLQRALKELKNQQSFGGLIIQLSPAEAQTTFIQRPRPTSEDSARSLTNFFGTEKNTAATLTPSLWPKIEEKMSAIFKNLTTSKVVSTPPLRAIQSPKTEISSTHLRPHIPATDHRTRTHRYELNQEMVAKIGGYAWRTLRFIGALLYEIGVLLFSLLFALGRNLILLVFVAINYQGRRKNILEEWNKQYHSLRSNLAQLPLITKILTIGVFILVCIFSGSILVLRYKQQNTLALVNYNARLKSVSDKIDSAKSSLLYGDEIQSLQSIKEAEELLAQLPCAEKETKNRCEAFNADLENIRVKVRKITTITPELITTWTTAQGAPLNGVIKLKNRLLAYSNSEGQLYSYDLNTKEAATVPLNFALNGLVTSGVPKENDYALFQSTTNELLRFEPDSNTIKKVDVSYPNDNPVITAFTVYNRRLYTLDANNNQIYKHDTIKTGFGLGKNWLKETLPSLHTGTDLSIDGDIWAITSEGAINRLVSGQPQPFAIVGLDPAIGGGAKLWTYNDLTYVYILDGKNKRLILADKEGRLKTQLIATQFENPSDFTIDETGRTAYIVDGTKLFKVALPL